MFRIRLIFVLASFCSLLRAFSQGYLTNQPTNLANSLNRHKQLKSPVNSRKESILSRNRLAKRCDNSLWTSSVDEVAAAIPKTFTPTAHKLSTQQFVYVVLNSIFVTCLVVADMIGVKIFEIPLPFKILGHSTVEHTCGMLTFPITFLLGDIINEYYGAKATRRTVYIGLAMSVLVFGVMNLAQALPYLNKPFNGKNKQ